MPGLEKYIPSLKALGYLSLEQLHGAAEVAGETLSSYLGVPVDRLLDGLPVSASRVAAEEMEGLGRPQQYSLGFDIDSFILPAPAPSLPPAASEAEPLPREVNLLAEMPPIQDQGRRATGVAHAALATLEHYWNKTHSQAVDLSADFLYWNCKQNDGNPTRSGTWLRLAFPLLQRDGCCREATWRYQSTPRLGDEGQGPPPHGAQEEALNYRIAGSNLLAATAVEDLKAELRRGRCVAFSIPVYDSWLKSPWVAYTGNITLPIPNEVRIGGQAMCCVGYVDLPRNPQLGGGRFLVRNSWGGTWGVQCIYGKGYGTIPYAYIARHGVEAYSIR